MQGRRKHLKLGGHDASRSLFPLERGAFSKNNKSSSLFIANLRGTCPQCPSPRSYVYGKMLLKLLRIHPLVIPRSLFSKAIAPVFRVYLTGRPKSLCAAFPVF